MSTPTLSPSPWACEILVMFNDTVLTTVYLGDAAPCQKALVLGENEGARVPDVEVAADALGSGGRQLEVVRWQDGQVWLTRPVDGEFRTEALPDGGEARVEVAGLTLLVRPTERPERLPRPRLLTGMSWKESRCTVWSVVGHAALLVLLFSVPREARVAEAFEGLSSAPRFLAVTVTPAAPAPVPEVLKGADSGGGGGPPAPGPDGQAGSKDSRKTDGAAAVKERPNRPKLTQLPSQKLKPVIDARQAGLLGLLRAERATLGSVLDSRSALGEQAQDALGHLYGSTVGDARGNDGLGIAGAGTGAGCLVAGTCSTVASTGLGRYGTLPRVGIGSGNGAAGGRGAGGLGGRKAGVPGVSTGTAVVVGAGDKEMIRRIIRRHLNEVKYCYEKELTDRPNLFGRVVLRLVISPSGAVAQSSVAESTLSRPSAEACIAAAGRRWQFLGAPGTVQVTYPFVFQSAGR
jgi:hypothetical protein